MSQLSVDAVTAKTTNTDLTLSGNGTGTVVLPAGVAGFSSMQVFTASGTWTKPSGINKVIVIVTGGGGGGAGTPNDSARGGGAGGGTAIEAIDVSAISSETVTVGAGGSGGASGGNDGTAGGTSSFGSHCSATGGAGGEGSTAPPSTTGLDATAGGTGSGGDINLKGGEYCKSFIHQFPGNLTLVYVHIFLSLYSSRCTHKNKGKSARFYTPSCGTRATSNEHKENEEQYHRCGH